MIALDQGGHSAPWAGWSAPDPPIQPWIESVTSVRYPRGFAATEWLIVPDPSAHVIVRFGIDGSVRASVVGPRSRAVRFRLTGRDRLVALRLRPGAISGLGGGSARDWCDQAQPLADCVPAALRGRCRDLGASGGRDTAQRLTALFRDWVRDREGPDWRVEALLRRAGGRSRVGEIAADLGVSERGLRKTVGREAGLPPKLLLRIRRLHRAAFSITAQGAPLSRAAARAGFTDQAHMAREFCDLMGETPSAYRRRGSADAVSYKSPAG